MIGKETVAVQRGIEVEIAKGNGIEILHATAAIPTVKTTDETEIGIAIEETLVNTSIETTMSEGAIVRDSSDPTIRKETPEMTEM